MNTNINIFPERLLAIVGIVVLGFSCYAGALVIQHRGTIPQASAQSPEVHPIIPTTTYTHFHLDESNGHNPMASTNHPALPGDASDMEALQALAQARIIRAETARRPELGSTSEYPDRSITPMDLTGAIAFGTNRSGDFDIYSQNAGGNSSALPLVTSSGNDVTPVWSPDGSKLVFASDQDGDFDIYLRDVDGQITNLTQDSMNDLHPSWSPNGDQIIFISDRVGSYFQIYTMREDGTDVHQVGTVPDNNAMFPRYSPDGSRIAFMRASVLEPTCLWNWDIWLMDADGDNQRRLTTGISGDLYPNWSPDGAEIIYASCRNFLTADLYAVNPDTGRERQLTSWLLVDEWGATFSPNAAHIVFNTNIDGNDEVYIMSVVGGSAFNLTQNSAQDLAPSWTQREASGQYAISGRVTDANNNPINGVVISSSAGRTTTTDSNGNYTFSDLPAGSYTLTPSKSGYVFSPASQTLTVPPDQRQDFTGTSMAELTLTIDLEVSQAIQCLNNPDCFGQAHRDWCPEGNCDNAVPLVRGKSTWVRAYVRCDSNCGSVNRVLGWITPSTHPNKSHSSFGPAFIGQAVEIEDFRSDLSRTLNFILPPGWEGGRDEDLETIVDFTVEVYAEDSTDRGYTLTQRMFQGFRFRKRRPLDIRYVSVGYKPSEDERELPDANIIDSAHSPLLQRIFPAADINYQPLYTDVVNIDVSPLVYKSTQYERLVAQLGSIRTSIKDKPDLMFGWLPSNVTIQGTRGATWYGVGEGKNTPLGTANQVAFRTAAHEVGHELGLGHAPCQVAAGATWPYGQNDATIQEYGLDVISLTLVSHTAPDFMSYCGERFSRGAGPERSWISPYHYMSLFGAEFLRPHQQVARQMPPQDLLLVSGLVYLDGHVEFFPFYHVQTTPSVPSGGSGGYCLEFQGGAGESLANYCFDLPFVEAHLGEPTNIEHFVWALPYPVGTNHLTLKQGTRILGQVQVSAHVPSIAIISPTRNQSWSGTQTITWTASDADNDPLSFRVFYSPDDGQSWIPLSGDLTESRYSVETDWFAGSDDARIRVIASDGINTGIAEVESLHVARKGPRVSIVAPEDSFRVRPGRPLVLWSHAYDLEDGTLPDTALSWSSDLQGGLGTGSQLVVADLLPGQHQITLSGRDSDGNVAEATVTVFVGYRTYMPIILNNYPGLQGHQ